MSHETAWPEKEPDEVPSDEELEVEWPNESAPAHNPEVEEEEQA